MSIHPFFCKKESVDGECVSTRKLTEAFGWTSAEVFRQQDVQEMCRKLIDSVDSRMQATKNQSIVKNMLRGTFKTFVQCLNVDYSSVPHDEFFYDVQLTVKGNRNLGDAFADFVKPELLTQENKYFAGEQHGYQDAERRSVFTSLPPVLMLHLRRFEFSTLIRDQIKVHQRFEYQDELDLSNFVLGSASSAKEENIFVLHRCDYNARLTVLNSLTLFTAYLCTRDQHQQGIIMLTSTLGSPRKRSNGICSTTTRFHVSVSGACTTF